MARCRPARVTTRLTLEAIEDRCVPAAAVPADFPAATSTVESFEGLTDGTNSPQSPGLGFISPGAVSAFTFGSGVTLTQPVPNPGEGLNGVEVGDFALGMANFALGTNGAITSAADVPGGTAYLGLDANSASGPIGFTFAHDVGAVGAYVTAADGANVTLRAFDAAGNLLESVTQASVSRALWTAKDPSAFIGLKETTGIHRIEINGDFVVADLLQTAPLSPPPPPPPPPPVPALVGTTQFAAGADAGGGATVSQYDASGTVTFGTNAFPGTTGGVRTAVADFNGDGVPDLAVATGPGAAAQVRVLDGVTHTDLFNSTVFEGFTGGVFVTAGDITGDGRADLILTPDLGGGPRVVVIRGGDFQQVGSFFGITDPDFRGGARAGVGDINGDGRADIAVSAGFQGGPRVAAFDGVSVANGNPTKLFNDMFVFDPVLRNGVYVAVGDVNGDGFGDLIAGAGPGGGPRVLTLSGKDLIAGMSNSSQVLTNFFAGNVDNRGGIRVAAKNLDGDVKADLVVGDGAAGSQVTAYLGKNFAGADAPAALAFAAFPGFTGGVFVG